jgi:Cu2+-exporting ATPase
MEIKMTIQKETYPVLGMTCAVCVAKIEKVLGNTDGINEASVNFASENVTISYDDDIISLEKITGIIKDIGYELLT